MNKIQKAHSLRKAPLELHTHTHICVACVCVPPILGIVHLQPLEQQLHSESSVYAHRIDLLGMAKYVCMLHVHKCVCDVKSTLRMINVAPHAEIYPNKSSTSRVRPCGYLILLTLLARAKAKRIKCFINKQKFAL